MAKNKNIDFILASASPRRKNLLTQAGYDFTIIVPDIDEDAFLKKNIEPLQFAKTLAEKKAEKIARDFPDSLVLAADTIVDWQGRIIGKPKDQKDAERIVKLLFSQPHKVITAIALIRLNSKTRIIDADSTIVYPKKMSPIQIDQHLRSKSWQGKAGAYAIQETADQFVEKIQGSLTNVMGLPMELLSSHLEKLLKNKMP